MLAATVSRATSAEYSAACRVLFAGLAPEIVEARAERVERLITGGEVDPEGLLVARVRGRVAGAVLIQLHPGRAAVVSPPGSGDDRITELLARIVIDHLRDSGVVQAQSILAPAEQDRGDPLVRVGFRAITHLVFLCTPLTTAPPPDPSDSLLSFQSIEQPGMEFADLLAATYEETQDCPELDGLRTSAEVLTGYQVTSREPVEWIVAATPSGPVGVIILTMGPQPGIRELSYLGLIRSARGQGLGKCLLRQALSRAQAFGAEWLTLSVDERNERALQLYRRHDFRPFDRQAVLLWTPDA